MFDQTLDAMRWRNSALVGPRWLARGPYGEAVLLSVAPLNDADKTFLRSLLHGYLYPRHTLPVCTHAKHARASVCHLWNHNQGAEGDVVRRVEQTREFYFCL